MCSNLLQLWHNLEVMYPCTLLFLHVQVSVFFFHGFGVL